MNNYSVHSGIQPRLDFCPSSYTVRFRFIKKSNRNTKPCQNKPKISKKMSYSIKKERERVQSLAYAIAENNSLLHM